MKQKEFRHGPTVAPGIDTEEQLNKSASKEDIQKGESTPFTTLSLDENDPS